MDANMPTDTPIWVSLGCRRFPKYGPLTPLELVRIVGRSVVDILMNTSQSRLAALTEMN